MEEAGGRMPDFWDKETGKILTRDAGYWMVVCDKIAYWNRMALGMVDFWD